MKFKYGDHVIITKGVFKGCHGILKNVIGAHYLLYDDPPILKHLESHGFSIWLPIDTDENISKIEDLTKLEKIILLE